MIQQQRKYGVLGKSGGKCNSFFVGSKPWSKFCSFWWNCNAVGVWRHFLQNNTAFSASRYLEYTGLNKAKEEIESKKGSNFFSINAYCLTGCNASCAYNRMVYTSDWLCLPGGGALRFAVIGRRADFQGRLFDPKYFRQGANLSLN